MPKKWRHIGTAAFLLVGLAGCGETPVQQDDPPENPAVRIEIAVDSIFLVSQGDGVRLEFTAYDAAGNPVDPGVVAWTSRDRSVARTKPGGLVGSVADGRTVVVGRLGSGAADSVFVRVELRAAAVEIQPRTIELTSLGPGGQVSYEAVDANGYLLPEAEYRWWTSDSTVVTVEGFGSLTAVGLGTASIAVAVDEVADTVPVSVDQRPAEVVVTPDFSYSEAPGTSFQLSGEVRDANGNPMEETPVSWHSSDTMMASVDGSGLVTAHATGSAGIFARTGNVEGASGVTIGDPGDWDAAPEWHQAQGTERHSGYVPVALDPDAFSISWSQQVAPVERLHHAVVEDDLVAFSTWDSYTQRVGVVSGPTGAVAWVMDFGTKGLVGPAAMKDGLVYVTTRDRIADDATLWGLDAATGDSIYAQTYRRVGRPPHIPVLAGGRVYLGGGSSLPELLAFDAATGSPAWTAPSSAEAFTPPAAYGGTLYSYTGRLAPGLWGVDQTTGAESSRSPDPDFIDLDGLGTKVTAVTEGGKLILVQADKRLLAYELGTGSLAWERQGGFADDVAVAGGEIFVRRNGGLEVLRESDGAPLWTWINSDHLPLDGSMVITRNLVILGTIGATFAVHRESHEQVWSIPVPGTRTSLSRDGHLHLTYGGTIMRIAVR